MKRSVLLTGASGFVGRFILAELLARGHQVSLLTRRPVVAPESVRQVLVDDLRALNMRGALEIIEEQEVVIHAAGHAHVEDGAGGELHRQINRDVSILLAQAAAQAKAHFVFLSSIKAQIGEKTSGLVRESDPAMPDDAYGNAKLEAEIAIRAFLPDAHTIIRPVLICGPGAKGNLSALMRLVNLPLPLPFGAVSAQRSLISGEDVAAIAADAIEKTNLVGKTLIAAHPDTLDLRQIVAGLRKARGHSPMLFSVPPTLLATMLKWMGKEKMAVRLFNPLVAEPATLLASGWVPRLSPMAALEQMARHAEVFLPDSPA